MSGSATRESRQSRLIDYLRDRRNPVPVSDLAHDLGVTVRTVLRDAEALRVNGFRLIGSRGRGGGLSLDESQQPVDGGPTQPGAPVLDSLPVDLPINLKIQQPAFVGRSTELAALNSAFFEAGRGYGRVVLITGEAGIGKTRLAQQAATEFERREATVVWGRCLESEGALPYWPWAQIIRSYARDKTRSRLLRVLGDGAADLGEIVPEVFNWFPTLERAPIVMRPESARFRLFRSIGTFLENAAVDRPLVLVLEDLHRADASSLLLLEFLAQHLGLSKVLVIGTYRDEEIGRTHPLTKTLAELIREPGLLRLTLRGLNETEINELLELTFGRPPDEQTVRAIIERTEGNPMFVSEMSVLLLQADEPGDGFSDARLWRRQIRIPEGIKEAIGQRLDRISPDANKLLRYASVLGKDFSVPELRALLMADSPDGTDRNQFDSDILTMLDEATRSRLLDNLEQEGKRFQFTHSLFRDTLYQELSVLDRVRLHLLAGSAIEGLYQHELSAHHPQLAHHFLEAVPAGQAQKAVRYAEQAGRHAAEMIAHEEAVRFFDMALQALSFFDQPDESKRFELLMARGVSERAAGELLKARATFMAAFQLAERNAAGEMCAEAAIAFENAGWHPGMHGLPAVRLLRTALSMLSESDSGIRARSLASLGRALNYSGHFGPAIEVGDQAIEMARRTGDARTLAMTLWTRLPTRSDPRDIYRRVEIGKEAIQICEQLGESDMAIDAEAWLMNDLTELGSTTLRNEVYQSWRSKILKVRDPMWLYNLDTKEVAITAAEGQFDEAEELANSAMSKGENLRGLDASGIHGAMMFCIRKEQGRLHEVAPALELFLKHRPTGVWRPGLALLFAELDRRQEARAEFDLLAGSHFSAVPHDALETCALAYLSDVCAYLADKENAAVLYDRLKRYEGRTLNLGVANILIGPAARYLGELATVTGDWAEAERQFDSGIQTAQHMGTPTQLAHIQLLFGTMLQKRCGPGDWQRARGLFETSLHTARKLGMQSLARKAMTALMERRPDASEVNYLPAGLSARETDVLKLLAAGLSNREIGEALFITPNTVANHVKSILQKTGAANRTGAAAFAVRNHLAES